MEINSKKRIRETKANKLPPTPTKAEVVNMFSVFNLVKWKMEQHPKIIDLAIKRLKKCQGKGDCMEEKIIVALHFHDKENLTEEEQMLLDL